MTTTQDILGPRFEWELAYTDELNDVVQLYGGEWSRIVEEMGEDCCWRETQRKRLTIGEAIDLVGATEAATAQLAYVRAGYPLKASLSRALSARGLALA